MVRLACVAASTLFVTACSGGGGAASNRPLPAPSATFAAGAVQMPSGPTLTQSTDWVTFGHDLQRSNLQPAAAGLTAASVAQLQLLWTYRSANAYDLAGPIEAGGFVYAVDYGGNVVALNAASGTVVWQRALGVKVKMTPALLGGRLFVATHDATSPTAQSTLYALDPASGSVLWQRSINGGVNGSPVEIAGRIYLPISIGDRGYCHPGGISIFDAQTGGPGFEWQTEPSSVSDGGAVWSSVTYDGSHLLFGTGNTCTSASPHANAIVSLDTGAGFRWADQTGPPLTDDDVGGTPFVSGGVAYVNAKNGKTYAVDATTGRVRWAVNLGAPDLQGGFSTPAMGGSTLIASGGFPGDPYERTSPTQQYGMLYGLDPASGAQRWKITALSPFWSPVATTPDLVIATADANVVDLDSSTGATVWSAPIVSYSRAQPAIALGEIFVADASGRLYAFGLPTASNASLRKRSASVVRDLPHYHVVPFDPSVPAYCRF